MLRTHILVKGSLFFLLIAANSHAQLNDLPFKAEDFDKGDLKVYWHRPKHSDSGVQEHGYDLGAVENGFSPILVESSVSGGQVRYTAVFVKGQPSDIIMRHGLTVQDHNAELAAAKKRNLSPVNISVISIGGERRYTVLYRPEKVGAWEMKSQIPEADYQAVYNDNSKAGRKPIYLNAYMQNGQPFISAIFASKPTGPRKDRHLMSAKKYQDEWASALKAGMLTHAVTSVDGAQSQHRFAASWWK